MTKTILLVDDSPMVMQCTLDVLGLLDGVQVVTAKNGVEAVALVESGLAFDLLLTDRQMPLMGGEALVIELRSRGCGQPFILMTGDVTVPKSIPGVDIIIRKPYRVFELLDAVRDRMDARAVA